MSEIAGSRPPTLDPVTETGDPGGSGRSTTEQAREKVQEGAELVQEKAQELKVQAGDRVRQQLDTRSTEAGSQLRGTAEAMRRMEVQLQQEGKHGPAQATGYVAEQTERLGSYLAEASSDQLLRDVEGFARRQPWLVALGGATLGFFASRFLKASSSRRYQKSFGSGDPRQPWPQRPAAVAGVGSGTSGPPIGGSLPVEETRGAQYTSSGPGGQSDR